MSYPPSHPSTRRALQKGLQLWVALSLFGSLAACGSSPTAATAVSTRRPTPSPTPSLTVSLDSWHFDPPSGHVIGLVTLASGPPSSDVVLEVSLHDAQGKALETTTVQMLNPYLLASSQGLFAADFSAAPVGATIRVRVISHRREAAEIVSLEGEVLEADFVAGTALAVLGRLVNSSDTMLRLESPWVVGVDRAGQPRSAARGLAGADALAPGESTPFRADALDAVDVARWIVLAQGSPRDAPGTSAVEVRSLRLQHDPQGKPFATGWLANRSDRPRAARLLVLATAGDEWLSAGALELPVPLLPSMTLAFSIADFPGLADRLPQGTDAPPVELVAFVADEASPLSIDRLAPEVTGFDVIGSRLYLRGMVRNEGQEAVDRPAVFAAIRSSEGDLITAGWTQAADRLGPGEAVPFLLTVPVPDGVDLPLAEYEIEAFGTRR